MTVHAPSYLRITDHDAMGIGHEITNTLLKLREYIVRNQVILLEVSPPKLPGALLRFENQGLATNALSHDFSEEYSKHGGVLAFVIRRGSQIPRERSVTRRD
jgi:hypothetical protein